MISVLVVTYNGETYIREQIDSILKNIGLGDELVVSDDGSLDTTREILKSYQEQDARIRVMEGPGEGVIANVEAGLRACRGDYIFLADQDDDARVTDAACKETLMQSFFVYRHSGRGAIKNIIKNTYMGCCMAFRKEVLDAVLPIPKDVTMHDQWIGVKCDLKYHRTVFLKEPLILYRRHEKNVSDFSHNSVGVMIKNRLIFLKRILSYHG